jgi:hypothetical protein
MANNMLSCSFSRIDFENLVLSFIHYFEGFFSADIKYIFTGVVYFVGN